MTVPERRGPKPLGEVLGALFASRGYGRLHGVGELERAWESAVGAATGRQTRLGAVRRGVLTVTVAHPALLEELAAFRKPELLATLQREAPGSTVRDIRFRVGPVGPND
jgi:predicted nucleic acid-binding Zn ribbon protein